MQWSVFRVFLSLGELVFEAIPYSTLCPPISNIIAVLLIVLNVSVHVLVVVVVADFVNLVAVFFVDIVTLIVISASMVLFSVKVSAHVNVTDGVAVTDVLVLVCLVGVGLLYVQYTWSALQ